VGALSVGATLALAGGMAAGAHAAGRSSTTVTSTPSSSSSSGSSSSGSSYGAGNDDNTNSYDDGSSSWSQFNVPAQSGNASSNPATSSHAS
jgi:hypothetical protein